MDKEIPIMSLDIQNEMDIMLAHRRAMQFAKFCGLTLSEQTRFATAVSEISRNTLEYAFKGTIRFSICREGESCSLHALVKDEGPGIANLAGILERKPEGFRGRGLGIVYARRLADHFKINSNSKGTTVIIENNIHPKNANISKLVVQGWLKHLEKEPVISAYEELKLRNIQLVELTEELRTNAKIVDNQISEIRKLNIQLSNSNDRMKEFTYAISHDLKTPLSSLKMASQYLEVNPKGKDADAFRNILSRSVRRLDKIIHSLIEIIDLQDQNKQLARELSFSQVLKDVREEYKEFITEADASIENNFKVPAIKYIEGYLQSIFHNLVSNSLKYRDGSRPLLVKVSTTRVGAEIILTFTDNGSGMNLEFIKERLFKPFSRFSNNIEGKGIGLYLIKGMVENNGGKVEVESKPGHGTTFTFRLVPY